MLFHGWLLWWGAVSCLTCVVASRAVLTVRAGEDGGLILPALAKSAPTLPSPPRHHGTARCAACGYAGRGCQWLFLRLPVWACGDSPLEAGGRATTSARSRRSPATRLRRQRVKKPWSETAGAHGIARARGEPFRQSLLAACGGRGSPLERAQSEAASARISRAKQHHPTHTDRQPEVTPAASPLPWSIDPHQNGHHRGGNVSAVAAGCRPSPARPRPRRPGGGSGSWRSGAAVCGHRLR